MWPAKTSIDSACSNISVLSVSSSSGLDFKLLTVESSASKQTFLYTILMRRRSSHNRTEILICAIGRFNILQQHLGFHKQESLEYCLSVQPFAGKQVKTDCVTIAVLLFNSLVQRYI